MKKVLIIGNGFDIAHGLPTKFTDFSKYLLNEILVPDLIKTIANENYKSTFFNPKILEIRNEYLFPVQGRNYSLWGIIEKMSEDNLSQFQEETLQDSFFDNKLIYLKYLTNDFLFKLYEEENRYWFDIESSFYRELIRIHELYDENVTATIPKLSRREVLNKLNKEFYFIKESLKHYLTTLEIENNGPVKDFIKNFVFSQKSLGNTIIVIDFNYTKTFQKFFEGDQVAYEYYPIHGTLDTDIIFGWGNDKDDIYQNIKLLEDEFLENFKTHKYLKASFYQEIYESLVNSSQAFHVHVLGHSLGLTDKTLLKEIFESIKCQKIYLYKRLDKYSKDLNKDDVQVAVEKEFTRLTMAMSRIIEDEIARVKIVNMTKAEYFPKNKH